MILAEFLKDNNIEYSDNKKDLISASHDASIFERVPSYIVYPKSSEDIKKLVDFVSKNTGYNLTARAGGTDMTGGPLSNSIIIDITKHLNRLNKNDDGNIIVEPGMFFRDFDVMTRKNGYILPSFPASRDLCTVGGMVANNAGGEKTLKYGKTSQYVDTLKVVLADGNEYKVRALDPAGLQKKMNLNTFEGEMYRKMYELVVKNQNVINKAKPIVTKNSAGYALWDIWDGKVFDLTKLFVGSQGTLGLITEIGFNLIHPSNYSGMLVLLLDNKDFNKIPNLVESLKKHGAETLEAYDKYTFKLATRYFYDFAKIIGIDILSLLISFLPELWMLIKGGVPDMVILAEFAGNSEKEVKDRVRAVYEILRKDYPRLRMELSARDIAKYRAVRRSSFQLLRTKLTDKKPASFIDDLIVPVQQLPVFLPALEKVLLKYNFIYTVAGHIGDGNFHIIPLLDQKQLNDKAMLRSVMDEVYDLVIKNSGSITAEHNDGILRVKYLKKMFGEDMYDLLVQTKKIFDPKNIFNPGKKIDLET